MKTSPLTGRPVTFRVPASTSNLGPGFDSLGVALGLFNEVEVRPARGLPRDPFFQEAGRLFFSVLDEEPRGFAVRVRGEVPRSRGLGSSVTVRLGLLAGLNVLCGEPMEPEAVLQLVIELEGHPDNAVPSALGGFAACSAHAWFRCEVESKLKFVTVIPSMELATAKARAVLPAELPRAVAVSNLQNSALITAAFASRHYDLLSGHHADGIHQPYRAPLVSGFAEAVKAATDCGALGAFLSGAGPTVIAVTTERTKKIADAMVRALREAGHRRVRALVLKADNEGMRRVRSVG